MSGRAACWCEWRAGVITASLLLALLSSATVAYAEGRCPPGQYPIGSTQGVLGCAPIPGGDSGASASAAPVPSGRWEKRWGAIADDVSANARGVVGATGVSESRKSKPEAESVALEQCRVAGGQKCAVMFTYNNQCVALADPPRGTVNGKSVSAGAENVQIAKENALKRCSAESNGANCSVVYSACSMSEFRSFK